MKNIVIKYLSLEAIENTITSLYYKIDGIIFLGRETTIEEEKGNIKSFLEKVCFTQVIDFINIKNKKIEDVVNIINSYRNNDDNRYFIDLTGSDGLFTAAAIACSKDFPLHVYDVVENRSINISTKYQLDYSIDDVEKRNVKLNIRSYIEMVGGQVINNNQNSFKYEINENVIELRNKHKDIWNYFSNIINQSVNEADSLSVYCKDLPALLNNHITNYEVKEVLKDAESMELVKNLSFKQENSKIKSFNFDFVDNNVKHLIKNTGSIFEQIVYLENKKAATDCMISVSLDWDGDVKVFGVADIRNEIDVIRLDNHLITFISCKNRELKKEDIYELESIARNFAGNYAHMTIATPYTAKEEIVLRAKELGVKIEYYI